eukprot:1780492-Karenia_brevis.AAC.1
MEQLARKVQRQSFMVRKAAWKMQGRNVCRHGVFFSSRQKGTCPCLQKEGLRQSDWEHAKFMPMLCADTKAILTTRFDPNNFKRIGVLRAQARRLNYY